MKRLILSVCLLSLLVFSMPVQASDGSNRISEWLSDTNSFVWKSANLISYPLSFYLGLKSVKIFKRIIKGK